MTKPSILNIIFLAIVLSLAQISFFANFQQSIKVKGLDVTAQSASSTSNNSIISSSSISKSSSLHSSSKNSSSASSKSQSSKSSSTINSVSSNLKPSSSSSATDYSSTTSQNSPASSKSSSKSSSSLLIQKDDPLPLRITEIGFMRPEEYNNTLCKTSENNCGQFKWLEIYNPNDTVINLHDYKIVFGTFVDNSITDSDFFIQSKSFGLIKNYSVTQTTSIIDDYPQLAFNGFVKNIDNKSANNISVAIENKFNKVIDSIVINNLSAVAVNNSGKTKYSLFRCSDPSKNQNFTFTSNETKNKIPFDNSLGYEFYGTPGRDDDSCKLDATSFSGGITFINNSEFKPKTTAKNTIKTPTTIVNPVKNSITELATVPVIKPTVQVKVPEIAPTPALVTSFVQPQFSSIQITNLIIPKITTPEIKIEPAKVEVKEVIPEVKIDTKKLVEFYKQIKPAAFGNESKLKTLPTTNVSTATLTNQIYSQIDPKQPVKALQVIPTSKVNAPILNTKKIILEENKYSSEPAKVIEIDYQPAQAQWNFLSLIAVVYVFSNIYKYSQQTIKTYHSQLSAKS